MEPLSKKKQDYPDLKFSLVWCEKLWVCIRLALVNALSL